VRGRRDGYSTTCTSADLTQLMNISLGLNLRKNHSTAICTHIFKKTVIHYRQNGDQVFACFIDFNKAFDNVNYWLLFCKLIDNYTSVTCCAVTRLIAYWYSNQQMSVRWRNISSTYFRIANGVRQGGILSPFLFRTGVASCGARAPLDFQQFHF